MKKALSLLLSAIMLLGVFTACQSSGSGGSSSTLNLVYSGEVTTLNYLTTGNTNEMSQAANFIDCLVEYDQYGGIQPSLAETWETSPDNLTWTFHLRKGVKWVDNTGKEVAEVTANDFVAAAKYALDAKNDSGTNYMYEGIVKNASEYLSYTTYLVLSDNGKKDTDEDGEPIEKVDEVKFEDVGVKAQDEYTLVFTLENPTPYFLTVLSYGCYLPVYEPFLEECGELFGTDNTKLLYCGAYYLSELSQQSQRVLTKNPLYWDKDKVYIEKIVSKYNAEASTLEPEMFKRGETDQADIGSQILDSWLNDEATASMVRPSRSDASYSYFYAFNFDPQFDAEYEPENWKKAVNNENFRKAVMAALNRKEAKAVMNPKNAESMLINTVTPPDFCSVNGVDFTQLEPLKAYTEGDSYDEAKAKEYKDAAKSELSKAGVTFPIKVLMSYNPSSTDWDKECTVVEQQIESVLGSDFIDIICEAGPSTGFLGAVRRSGKYALMKCNWGCDYEDPQTWTDPFAKGNSYNFMDTSKDSGTQAVLKDYYAKVDEAKAEVNDIEKRYTLFAEAEAMLLEHAIVIPYSLDGGNYMASKLSPFDGQYAPYGVASHRYKGKKILEKPMSEEEYNAAYAKWQEERAAALAK